MSAPRSKRWEQRETRQNPPSLSACPARALRQSAASPAVSSRSAPACSPAAPPSLDPRLPPAAQHFPHRFRCRLGLGHSFYYQDCRAIPSSISRCRTTGPPRLPSVPPPPPPPLPLLPASSPN